MKYLQNFEKIKEWINFNESLLINFAEFPFVGRTDEECLIVFTLNEFLKTFLNDEIPEKKYSELITTQNFLLRMNTMSIQLLLIVLNDVIEVESQVDNWVSILQCSQRGVPKPAETRLSARNLFSKISVTSNFINYRINLNIVATQLNSLYQSMLFQVLQLKTMDPAQREELLCPTFSMDMFK